MPGCPLKDEVTPPSVACKASLDATSRRPEPQNGFPSTLSVLGTAVPEHFHYLDKATHRIPRSAPPR
ncbi:hypothetical protein DPMN_118244 [Dreissena polymorpha]|uniref:Uncharacterized protein n=1 Tax=Dreissena polymorpha TaxID=45954 RepID=A0A9D4JQ24_DREPO|nr:hypothetical protein DPMN_118244 [Dreissena polymorpha]